MADVTFYKGDTFHCSNGYGVVLSGRNVLLIRGSGGRTGWHPEKVTLPEDAVPHNLKGVHFEVRFALETVQIAIR